MEILDYSPNHLDELAAAYGSFTARIPHCYAVTAAELGSALRGELDADGEHRLSSQGIGVAIDDGVLGFVHVGETPVDCTPKFAREL